MAKKRTGRSDYLHPEVVSRLANMELRARLIVEGLMAGLHRSPYHGFSAEFAEYRQYNAGESTKDIDWKVYGKTDRYYVKMFEDETNLKATILLDRSASMDYASRGVTKLTYATLLCAAIGYLMIKQRDSVGLAVFDKEINTLLPHRSVRKHLHYFLKTLEGVAPGKRTEISSTLHELAERLRRRGLVILVSDLMDEPESVIQGLKHFRHRGHEIIVFHVLDPAESTLDFNREVIFLDRETGEKLRVQPWFIRSEYRRSIKNWTAILGRRCKEDSIDYNLITTDKTYDQALISYLNKRRRLR